MLTAERKKELIDSICTALNELIPNEYPEADIHAPEYEPVEMLTIRECVNEFKGIKEHSIRQLVAGNKIPYFRTGQGKTGKILINKYALKAYLEEL